LLQAEEHGLRNDTTKEVFDLKNTLSLWIRKKKDFTTKENEGKQKLKMEMTKNFTTK
jgi:hypothetical protein